MPQASIQKQFSEPYADDTQGLAQCRPHGLMHRRASAGET